MQKKQLASSLMLEDVKESGFFSGYASVFEVTDRQKDVVMRGAFRESLLAQKPADIKLLWQHKPEEPIGVLTTIREDRRGLYVEGQLLLDVARAREAHSLLQSGALDGLSIGYTAKQTEVNPETGVRKILQADLWEVSLVTFPANELATVTSVKREEKAELPEEISPLMLKRLLRAVEKAERALHY